MMYLEGVFERLRFVSGLASLVSFVFGGFFFCFSNEDKEFKKISKWFYIIFAISLSIYVFAP